MQVHNSLEGAPDIYMWPDAARHSCVNFAYYYCVFPSAYSAVLRISATAIPGHTSLTISN